MKTKFKLAALLPVLPDEIASKVVAGLGEDKPELVDVKRVTMPAVMAEKAADDNQSIKVIASTRQMDHDREILFPMGCDLSVFKQSPKILECHDRSKPFVAKATKMSKNAEDVRMTIEFAPTEDGEKFRILSKFSPLSFSVGFIHNKVLLNNMPGWGDLVQKCINEWPEFKKIKDVVEILTEKWTLLENSIVPVGCNSGAMQLSASKAVEQGLICTKEATMCGKAFGFDTPTIINTKETNPKIKVVAEPKPISIKRVVSVKKYAPKVKLYSKPMAQAEINKAIADSVKEAFEIATGRI